MLDSMQNHFMIETLSTDTQGLNTASPRIAKADNVESKDIFYFLQNGKNAETGERFTVPKLVSEAALLIGAGTDTTAAAIATILFYLLHNPRTLQRLSFEILSVFSNIDELRGGLSDCVYLRACIDEAM
ncbi:MAG: hypothetical protein LQ342_003139 [Letrouitia transgressa]|nr:MAG: hypothetical protein LQ342_003139 [Letrouitia transgressa]